LPERLIVGN